MKSFCAKNKPGSWQRCRMREGHAGKHSRRTSCSGIHLKEVIKFAFKVRDEAIAGAPGPYTILVSSNLVDWQSLATVTNIGGSVPFSDPLSGAWAQRFYRVSAP